MPEEIKGSPGYNIQLQRQGFTFDVRLMALGAVGLIELDTLAAVRDFHQLNFGADIVMRLSFERRGNNPAPYCH
jgi:hypothetical protein